MTATITLDDLLSEPAIAAFNLADYHLRHNRRYDGWDEDMRLRHCLTKAYNAAIAHGTAKPQQQWVALHGPDRLELTPDTAPGYARALTEGDEGACFTPANGAWDAVYASVWTEKEDGVCISKPPLQRLRDCVRSANIRCQTRQPPAPKPSRPMRTFLG